MMIDHEEYLLRRQQAAAEAILEAEGLTADLTDQQAAPMLAWAARQAAIIASDPSRTDAEIEELVALVRQSVRRTGSNAIGTAPPAQLLSSARRELRELLESYIAVSVDDEEPDTAPPPPPPPPYNPPATIPAASPVVAGGTPLPAEHAAAGEPPLPLLPPPDPSSAS